MVDWPDIRAPAIALAILLAGTGANAAFGSASGDLYPFSLFAMFSASGPESVDTYELVAIGPEGNLTLDAKHMWHEEYTLRDTDAARIAKRVAGTVERRCDPCPASPYDIGLAEHAQRWEAAVAARIGNVERLEWTRTTTFIDDHHTASQVLLSWTPGAAP